MRSQGTGFGGRGFSFTDAEGKKKKEVDRSMTIQVREANECCFMH